MCPKARRAMHQLQQQDLMLTSALLSALAGCWKLPFLSPPGSRAPQGVCRAQEEVPHRQGETGCCCATLHSARSALGPGLGVVAMHATYLCLGSTPASRIQSARPRRRSSLFIGINCAPTPGTAVFAAALHCLHPTNVCIVAASLAHAAWVCPAAQS